MCCSILISAIVSTLAFGSPSSSQPAQEPSSQPSADLLRANAVVQGFVQALRNAEWSKAIGYCSTKVQEQAKTYASPEAFFRDVVPVKEFVAVIKDPIYGRSCNPAKGGPWCLRSLACKVAELEPDPADKWSVRVFTQVFWQARLQALEGGDCRIDFPTEPIKSYTQKRLAALKRVRDEAIATEAALEPQLKAVHTRLTPLEDKFRIGQPMLFRLELVNEGPSKLIYDRSVVGHFCSFTVKDSQGEPAQCISPPVQTACSEKVIEPGQTVVLLESWNLGKQYRLTEPGRYTVKFDGGVMISEADPHKVVHVHRAGMPADVTDTQPAPGRRSQRLFPSNVAHVEVVATQPPEPDVK